MVLLCLQLGKGINDGNCGFATGCDDTTAQAVSMLMTVCLTRYREWDTSSHEKRVEFTLIRAFLQGASYGSVRLRECSAKTPCNKKSAHEAVEEKRRHAFA
jgi:hypothetical protein